MFFCPFCSTLLLVEALPEGNALQCSTCRYVHTVASTRGVVATNSMGEPVLTIQHSFVEHNKKLMDAEDDAASPSGAAPVTSGASAAAPQPASTSGVAATSEASADDLVGDGSAEGGQIMTIPCQNEDTACDSTKAYYIQLQMRSADEPATVFFKCVKCGYQWRQD